MRPVSFLYKIARIANDVRIIRTGNPNRIGRRVKNKFLGRMLAKVGIWR